MRVLLDTNIIIHREANRIKLNEIGTLFRWLDDLHYQKCVHPLTIDEIRKHADPIVVKTFEAKINNYHSLQTLAPESPRITAIRAKYDKTENDRVDTSILNEVFSGRVDILITEDKKMEAKIQELGISERVFTVDAFLEKVVAENPDLVDYDVLAVRKSYFGNLNLDDGFFDSFKKDYSGFESWFNRKADEIAYVCQAENDDLLAFLYVKIEDQSENYSDIEPIFSPKRRLKIGTFKVVINGFKLGERFLKIVFDNAIKNNVDEIYVTIFDHTEDQHRLIELLQDWGFELHGVKKTSTGEELVYVRDFTPQFNKSSPNLTYPFISFETRKFIVPIYPDYHTELFPDSILQTESPEDFIENRPNRNAISKVYVSHSWERNLQRGDIIVFYRTKYNGPAKYTSVATTVGMVQNVYDNLTSLEQFIALCRKRSVFTDDKLREFWERYPRSRPLIVNFFYILTFTKGNRLNLEMLLKHGIIQQPPRGFEQLTDSAFETLMEKSNADKRYVVD